MSPFTSVKHSWLIFCLRQLRREGRKPMCQSIVTLLFFVGVAAQAETTEQFEIIEGNSQIIGDADSMKAGAKAKWKTACNEWKKETKEINRNERLIEISCNSPDCSSTDDGIVCSSSAIYKIKTSGIRVSPPPPQPALKPQVVTQTEMIDEAPPTTVVYREVHHRHYYPRVEPIYFVRPRHHWHHRQHHRTHWRERRDDGFSFSVGYWGNL